MERRLKLSWVLVSSDRPVCGKTKILVMKWSVEAVHDQAMPPHRHVLRSDQGARAGTADRPAGRGPPGGARLPLIRGAPCAPPPAKTASRRAAETASPAAAPRLGPPFPTTPRPHGPARLQS